MHIRFILSDSKKEDHQNSKIADSFSLDLTVRISGKCNNPNASLSALAFREMILSYFAAGRMKFASLEANFDGLGPFRLFCSSFTSLSHQKEP